MTPDNAPTVITTAEFVSGGYAQRVAAGECVVIALDRQVENVRLEGVGYLVNWIPVDDNDFDPYDYFETDDAPTMYVHWFPATPATGELASLRAQVARYREAMIAAADDLDNAYGDDVMVAARILRAALAETEEANG